MRHRPGSLAVVVFALVLLGLVLLALGLLAPPMARALETGQGVTGTWTLLWRLPEAGAEVNSFRREMGDVPFPFRSRVQDRGADPRILLFDADGNVEGHLSLLPGERALVADDGSAHLVWRSDPLRARHFEYRFYRGEDPEPAWDAVAPGEPVLFAPDGTLFVMVSPDTSLDRFQRAWLHPGGKTEVVDAAGNVRGELPILPAYVRMTGDRERIAMLHSGEIVVLRRTGILDWSEPVPIDAVVARDGHSQLEAGGGRIVVSGTGQVEQRDDGGISLQPARRGTLRAFSDDGRLLWKRDQSGDDVLWFQISLALSEDGETLATFHSTSREILVQLFDAATGTQIWQESAPRRPGTSCLSVSPDGQLVALVHADLRTQVILWSREGTVVWEGELPLASRAPRLGANGLLVADRWIVRLEPEGE